MLRSIPYTLHIDIVRQIPDLLRRINSVGIVGVHDTGVVEDDVHAAPGVGSGDKSFNLGFLGDVGLVGLDDGAWDEFLNFGEGFGQGGLGDIGHEHFGAFAGEKDGGFETDATVVIVVSIDALFLL